VALPLVILAAFVALFAGSLAASLTPSVDVTAVPVVERPSISQAASTPSAASGKVIVQAAGWIEPDPFKIHATALTDGSVKDVLFLEGDTVEKGDVLARMIDDDALLALQRAQAEARAAEEEWEANIEAQREAAITTASVRETEASLELAHAELEVEQALLREAERVYTRRNNLVDDGTIPQEEFETAEATALAQSAKVRVVESRIDELKAKLERMKAEAAAAQRRLELRTKERRELDLARVALAEAELRVERLEIRAPISGKVMQRTVEPGSMLMAFSENPDMAMVAMLYDPEKLQVRVDVPLADAAKVGVGQAAQVFVEVLPDRTFSGTVTRITNLADIQKNTLEVKVAITDPAPELKPEMLARVRFLATQQTLQTKAAPGASSVFAPAEAITNGTAWIVTQYDGTEGVAARRTVSTTGAEHDGWLEISTGLHPGDLVITSSAEQLQQGQKVRVTRGGVN
jgi:RND family efflux transporter MFP subunit